MIMTLKSEVQYQMYLDVLDIIKKNGFTTKVDKDGISTKTSNVYKNEKLCGKVLVVSTPPANRESSIYALSAHAGLVTAKEGARSTAENDRIKGEGAYVNFVEGEWTGADDCLFYFGHSREGDDCHEWVALVDKNFQKWREKSPLYFQIVGEMEKLKKKTASASEEYQAWEKEFKRLADSFSNISDYRDSKELSVECATFVAGKKEEVLKKLIKKFDKLNKSKGTTSKHFGEMIKAYTELSQKFTTIVPYLNAAEKISECEKRIEECEKEKTNAIYSESVAQMKELQSAERKMSSTPQELIKMISDYEDLLTRFSSIEKHEDSAAKVAYCAGEIGKFKAFWTNAAYKEASNELDELDQQPKTKKFFEYIRRARAYKNVAKKFESTVPHEDSAELKKMYKKIQVIQMENYKKNSADCFDSFRINFYCNFCYARK